MRELQVHIVESLEDLDLPHLVRLRTPRSVLISLHCDTPVRSFKSPLKMRGSLVWCAQNERTLTVASSVASRSWRAKRNCTRASEAQLHGGDRVWGGSAEYSCGPMNKNWIEGLAEQGEWANGHEALLTKGWWRRSGGRAATECVLTRGDLALRLKERRCEPEREVSRSRSRSPRRLKGETRRSVQQHDDARGKASDVRASGAVREGTR